MHRMDGSSLQSALLLIHLFGIILGAGGVFVSDGIFFTALKDRIISGDELRILRSAAHVIWIGIILLVISGIGLFLQDMERLSTSAKFISKMMVVLVIIINGSIFHFVHLPFIHGHLGKALATKRKPGKAPLIPLVLVSGVVSVISWTASVVLGSMRSIPISFGGFMAVYSGVIALAILCALHMFRAYLDVHNRRRLLVMGAVIGGISAILALGVYL